jgi:hypothetical protein
VARIGARYGIDMHKQQLEGLQKVRGLNHAARVLARNGKRHDGGFVRRRQQGVRGAARCKHTRHARAAHARHTRHARHTVLSPGVWPVPGDDHPHGGAPAYVSAALAPAHVCVLCVGVGVCVCECVVCVCVLCVCGVCCLCVCVAGRVPASVNAQACVASHCVGCQQTAGAPRMRR